MGEVVRRGIFGSGSIADFYMAGLPSRALVDADHDADHREHAWHPARAIIQRQSAGDRQEV